MMNTITSSITFTQWIPYLFVMLWSTGFIAAKYALPYVEPFTLLQIRMTICVAVFGLLILIFRPVWPSRRQIGHQLVVGSLIHAAYLAGVFTAIKLDMPTGITALLVGLQPLLTALIAWPLFGEYLSLRQWIGLSLGLIGVAIVLLADQDLEKLSLTFPAVVAAIIALVSISLGTLYQKHFGRSVDLLSASFFQYVATALWMSLFSILFEEQHVVWHPQLINALIWLILGLSIFATLLLMYMIREGEASKVASYFYLVPPLTAIEAWFLFDEELTIKAMIGVIITVIGVYLVLKSSRRNI